MVTDRNLLQTMIDVIDQVIDRNLSARTVTHVIDHYGYTRLASILNVRIDDLHSWVAGQTQPPTDVFLRIIELKGEVKKP
jgi:hypothetical protein